MKIDGRSKGPEVWGEKFDRCATICVKCSARLLARLGKATSAPADVK
jgi:hypothetical protein